MKKEFVWVFIFLAAFVIVLASTTLFIKKEIPKKINDPITPTHPDYIGKIQLLSAPACGDSLCTAGETPESCLADCPIQEIEPEVYIEFASPVGGRIYAKGTENSRTNNDRYWEDQYVKLNITYEGNYLWKLKLQNKNTQIESLSFPWQNDQLILNSDGNDDLFYYPYLTGMVQQANSMTDFGWWGLDYPGIFSPLVVQADDDTALITAAANWPPRKVKPMYSLYRSMIKYEQQISPSGSSEFTALTAKLDRSSQGDYPWMETLDLYRNWLHQKMLQENLYPLNYSDWMKNADGFHNIQLENSPSFDQTAFENTINKTKDIFPWVQMWGQMSNYADPNFTVTNSSEDFPYLPWNGTYPPINQYDGVPLIKIGEWVGCCHANRTIHPKYLPGLTNVISSNPQRQFGFYSRPLNIYPWAGYYEFQDQNTYTDWDAQNENPLDFFVQWQTKNQEYGAKAFYYDVLGAIYFGDGLLIAKVISNQTLPKDSFTEFPIDIYTSAFLSSGSLGGTSPWRSGADRQPENFDGDSFVFVAFPRFGRYLLNDRIIIQGQVNKDYVYWGEANQYWNERQVFLLGAKFDAIEVWEDSQETILNKIINETISERKRVGWWDREPIYQDRKGISSFTSTDVRVFKDKDNKILLAIDNWNSQESVSIVYNGNEYEITIPLFQQTTELSTVYIHELNSEYCGDEICQESEDEDSCSLDCDSSSSSDSENGGGENIVSCNPNWRCSGWTTCINSVQTQVCDDLNNCGTTQNKPQTTRQCDFEGLTAGENENENEEEEDRITLFRTAMKNKNLVRWFTYGLLGAIIFLSLIIIILIRKIKYTD